MDQTKEGIEGDVGMEYLYCFLGPEIAVSTKQYYCYWDVLTESEFLDVIIVIFQYLTYIDK